ncbi:MAG: serine/threonine protein kinase [Planctomycetes bacterium]|nr:serine/threonine protein kinase [Planctomycetota bacterium]
MPQPSTIHVGEPDASELDVDTDSLAPTVVSPVAESSRSDLPSGGASRAPVRLVQGPRAGLAGEIEALLRVRLRAAVVLLWIALAAYFVRGLFLPRPTQHLQVVLGLILIVYAAAAAVLWRVRALSLKQLRGLELVLFGGLVVYLGYGHWVRMWHDAAQADAVEGLAHAKSTTLYFVGTMLAYGIFIPNTWRRALIVVLPMALVPPALNVTMRLTSPDVERLAARVADFEQVSDDLLMLSLSALGSVAGAHIISTLRAESFRARELGQYRLKKLIGRGGMGQVYLAEHRLMKRPCAIKLIRPEHDGDPQALARFEREVRTAARLSHWNSIDIYDYGRTEDGTFYYVMEFLPGASLDQLVRRHGPLPAERAIHFLTQTCDALSEAHGIGLIHRDIKPANLFAARRGGLYDVTKLLDFGLVRQQKAPGQGGAGQSLEITQEGTISGSPLYMAPEQATGETIPDQRSDIYALGAVAYFLVTARPPFMGTNPLQVMIAHARDEATPPSKLNPEVPADLEAVILKCLSKRPADRYQTAAELRAVLTSCAAAGRWTEREANAWWHASNAAANMAAPTE